MPEKSLFDLTDKELQAKLRALNTTHGHDSIAREMGRRSQDRNTAATNRMTLVITAAAVVQAIASVMQALK